MLRSLQSRICSTASAVIRANAQRSCVVTSVRQAHHVEESAEQFDARYEAAFSDPSADGWVIRKLMNDLHGYDLIPEPKILIAAMKACRRLNDYALAVRYLEAVKDKCGPQVGKIWPYLVTQISPTLEELGIDTPEQLGYDKPELALQDVYDIH